MSPTVQAAWSSTGPTEIQTIAICAGSGGSILGGVKADLYLTGEMSHHEILAANAAGTHVFCCMWRTTSSLGELAKVLTAIRSAGNHTNTERPWLAFFAPRLQAAMNDAASGDGASYEVVLSQEDKEPLQVV